MNLSKEAERRLQIWAKTDTWHTDHNFDMSRFYGFIDQYAKDHGLTIDESVLQEHIFSITKTPVEDDNPLAEIIRERVSLMYDILDFLEITGR